MPYYRACSVTMRLGSSLVVWTIILSSRYFIVIRDDIPLSSCATNTTLFSALVLDLKTSFLWMDIRIESTNVDQLMRVVISLWKVSWERSYKKSGWLIIIWNKSAISCYFVGSIHRTSNICPSSVIFIWIVYFSWFYSKNLPGTV